MEPACTHYDAAGHYLRESVGQRVTPGSQTPRTPRARRGARGRRGGGEA